MLTRSLAPFRPSFPEGSLARKSVPIVIPRLQSCSGVLSAPPNLLSKAAQAFGHCVLSSGSAKVASSLRWSCKRTSERYDCGRPRQYDPRRLLTLAHVESRYLSYFYKGNELPIRLSIFWTAIPVTQIYGSLLAAGLLELRGVQDWAGWQWL